MKRPTEIRILGKVFSIRYCREEAMSLADYGHMSLRKQEIAIQEGLHTDLERDVLLHEVIHAIDEQLSLSLKEDQINSLGCAMAQVMADNPDFVLHLMRGMKWPTKSSPKMSS